MEVDNNQQNLSNQIPQQSKKQPVEQKINQTKVKNSFSLISILSFTTIIASLIAGFFYYQNMQLRSELQKKTESISTQTPIPTQTREENEEWKIYTGEDNKFTFKYPKEAEMITDKCISIQIIGPTQTEATETFDGLYLTFCPIILGKQTIDEWIESDMTGDNVETTKPKTIYSLNEYIAYEYIILGPTQQRNIVIQSPYFDSEMVVIRDTTQDPTKQGYEKIVEKIISTFKFIEN